MSRPRVTVVLPVFGRHRGASTVSVVADAWLVQRTSCEVVVATARDPGELGLRPTADSRLRVVVAEPAVRSIGLLRNLGASAARGELLYFSDADIVPMGDDFLRRALALRDDGVLIQPWMYRLLAGARSTRVWEQPAPREACFLTTDESGRLVTVADERFTWENDTLWVEPPPQAVHRDDSPAMIRRVPFHWGGLLLTRRVFDRVGGYCQTYAGWGAEDDDLLTKLSGRVPLIQSWRVDRGVACLHFEHPRANDGPELRRNQELLVQRRAVGASTMIEQDLNELARVGPRPSRHVSA